MRSIARWVVGGTVAAMGLSVSVAGAQTYQSSATLSQGQETVVLVPAPQATGFGTVTLNVGTNMLTVTETYSGLSTGANGAHIHCCAAPGATGPVAIDFPPNGFITGLTSGSYSRMFDLLNPTSYGSGFLNNTAGGNITTARNLVVNGFIAGQTYLNIHTPNNPGGEIRGNLTAVAVVPEPSTYLLMASGLAGVGLVARRRRTS